MTKAELKKMTRAQLLEIAAKNSIKVPAGTLKADLVEMLDKASAGAGKTGPKTVTASATKFAAGKSASKGKPVAAAKSKTNAKAAVRTASKSKTATSVAAPPALKKAAAFPTAQPAIKKAVIKVKAADKAPAKASAAVKKAVKKSVDRIVNKTAPKSRSASLRAAVKKMSPAPRRAVEKQAAAKPAPGSAADDRSIRQKAMEGKYQLTTGPVTMPPVESMDIPDSYDKTRIAMMVRDPYWLFTYWEISRESFGELERSLGSRWSGCRLVLRVYDRTAGEGYFDIETGYHSRSWYINVSPARLYQTAIGIMTPEGKFIEIASSNISGTPRVSVSDLVDDKWIVPDEEFEKIFSASGGYASSQSGSGELLGAMEQRLLEEMGSETISSFGSAGVQKLERERGFRLWVATELILYGATEPDARVTIQGKEVKLRGDGTFSARFALPDGVLDLPVTAVSSDEIEERTIETVVSKKSKEKAPVIR